MKRMILGVVCLLCAMSSDALVIVGLDLERGGESSIGLSPTLSAFRSAIDQIAPGVQYRSLALLTN